MTTYDTQRERHGLPSVETMARRVERTYLAASPSVVESGARWYADARLDADAVGRMAGGTVEHGAAALAHLSPQLPWSVNRRAAYTLAATGEREPGVMRRSFEMAADALHSDDPLGTLRGPKVRAFAANMLGDDEAVTVDVWALRVVLGDAADERRWLDLAGVYDAVARAYRLAARRLGVSPSTAQAVTWVQARNGRAG